jgi:hypothetical protein
MLVEGASEERGRESEMVAGRGGRVEVEGS